VDVTIELALLVGSSEHQKQAYDILICMKKQHHDMNRRRYVKRPQRTASCARVPTRSERSPAGAGQERMFLYLKFNLTNCTTAFCRSGPTVGILTHANQDLETSGGVRRRGCLIVLLLLAPHLASHNPQHRRRGAIWVLTTRGVALFVARAAHPPRAQQWRSGAS
jgi:hypothetical protein